MDLRPTVISHPHPLVGEGRQYSYVTFLKGETLGQYIERNDIQLPRGTVSAFVNGERLIDDRWHLFIPESGDQIVIRSRAEGGRAGKILRLVAMVALVVVGQVYGAALGGALGFTGTTAAAVGSSLIMVGGSLLLNALLPPPRPAQLGSKEKNESPTYGISAGRNQMSPYSPMILVFGTHKVVPFHGSKPYSEYVGNDQFLSQAFHFGLQPNLDLSDIKIGQTSINNYDNVEINRSGPDGKLTLIAGNVDTLDGFDLKNSAGWVQRTTPLDTEFISVDLACNLYEIDDEGEEIAVSVEVESQYKQAGSEEWLPLDGMYTEIAYHYWSLGQWTAEKSGEENKLVWQQVDYGTATFSDHEENEPTQICEQVYSWLTRDLEQKCTTYYWRWLPHPFWSLKPWRGIAPDPIMVRTGTGLSRIGGSNPRKPTRRALNIKVPRGQYDVRFRKISGDIETNRKSNNVTVAQIRCHQADDANYYGQLRLGVRIKATSQLSGTLDELSAIARAKCHIWQNNAWVEAYTENPAWWYLWFVRGMRDNEYNRMYGECLPDSKIDIEAIKAWALFCDQKGLTFNWVLDRKMSIEDVLYTIARAGRASVTWQSGKRGVIFDSAGTPVATLVTPANIIAGSFSYQYINTELADEIIINFYNKDRDYEKDVVRQRVPNTPTLNNPITLDLEGCVDVDMAGREANLLAASQFYHRKQYQWEQDIEGMVVTRGDVVQLTHDLTAWGKSGRLLSVSGNTLTLDGYVAGAANGWMSLRSPDNQIAYVRTQATGDSTDSVVILGGWPEGFPVPNGNAIDYIWQYNPLELPGKKLQIKSVVPTSNGNVKYEAIEYIDEYYLSENDAFAHASKAPVRPALINVFGITAAERITDEVNGTVDVTFTWTLSEKSNSNVYIYINGESFTSFNTEQYMTVVSAVHGDVIDIEVHPSKDGRGVLKRHQYTVNGTLFVIPAVASLTTAPEVYTIRLNWMIPSVNYIERTEIWYSASPELNTAQKLTDLAYPQQEYRQAGLRAGAAFYYWVRLVDRFGNIGSFYPSGNGVYGESSTDANAYMELFEDEFVSSIAGQQLRDEIDIINGDVFTEGSIAAAVKAASDELIDSDIVLAEAIETVEIVANGAAASAQTNANAIATTDGKLSSTITTKVQILSNGQRVIAGTGLGIEYTPDQGFQSSFNVWADRFAVWSGDGTDLFSPFVVSGGQVFINDAVIGELSAGKIGAGIYDVGKDGYGLIRSNGKTYGSGNGFFFETQASGQTAMELVAGPNNELWFYYDPQTGEVDAGIDMGGAFYVDSNGNMNINKIDVIERINIKGNAVTTAQSFSAGPFSWGNLSFGESLAWDTTLTDPCFAIIFFKSSHNTNRFKLRISDPNGPSPWFDASGFLSKNTFDLTTDWGIWCGQITNTTKLSVVIGPGNSTGNGAYAHIALLRAYR